MRLNTALKLGRVSNLPTVWTNTLAGVVIAAGAVGGLTLATMILAFSLFYVGGMFLNDAYDARFDAVTRPERPIPSGEVSREAVFGYGYAMLGAGVVLLLALGYVGQTRWWPAAGGVALAATIVLYDRHHKNNPMSPLIMGLCRVLVYISAALCLTAALPREIWIAALLVLCYLIGLTYIAKQENLGKVENLWPLIFLAAPVIHGLLLGLEDPTVLAFWLLFTVWIVVALRYLARRGPGDIPRAVVSLIAGISLLDAMLIAGAGSWALALLALAGFGFTLFFQRYITGT
ncbi:MAG TPA: UbiA family prenyltransferase [Lautropia sp.]|jgi:4-hydroxybenzoate polyprenyltransferase|nr:UbiA family prenyltransferase [Lautropia sp.]